ncbi:MAG: chlorophyllide a reductase subunit Y [Chloroherpetonaceae bacterium]|nr:chlorophyllide a reductase subunit Y [Chloroherpetonaceae bacterium]MDW8437699.1 chlorophyllide a reductase subunit Y [Chloroherpetonaceae bacterium]
MCPAFGGLRVLTRIDGAQVCLATDKGCMYGLTFVTHFYAAKKSIVSPEVMSTQLSSGTMIDDIRKTLEEIAKDKSIRLIPVVSLCVAETAGIAEELLPKKVGEAEVALVRIPAYLIKSHPEAKDIAVEALLKRFALPPTRELKKSVAIVGEIFPLDAMMIGQVLQRIGVESVLVLPSQQLEDYKDAGDVGCAVALHPFYERVEQFYRERGTPVIAGNPVGANSTYKWIKDIGDALNLDAELVERVAQEEKEKIKAVIAAKKINATIIVAGYEGNEFPLVRLLLEAGANVPYASTSIARTKLGDDDHKLLTTLGTELRYRKYLEEDRRAVLKHKPDLVLGTTSLDSYVKEQGIPAVYYTNIVSSRPIYFAQGASAMLDLIQSLIRRRGAFEKMKRFFEGDGDSA